MHALPISKFRAAPPVLARRRSRLSGLLLAVVLMVSPLSADTILKRTTLLVSDLERSISFYSALGLRPYYDAAKSIEADGAIIGGNDLPLAGEPGVSRIVILAGPDHDAGMLGLLAYQAPQLPASRRELSGLGRGDAILMFTVADIQQVHQAVVTLGARIHREPYPFEVRDNEGRLRASGWRMFVYDPEGRLVEVAQSEKTQD
jgi:catechol 2,3-dioxygenase-like lactoylglutathione lyase family enzyme